MNVKLSDGTGFLHNGVRIQRKIHTGIFDLLLIIFRVSIKNLFSVHDWDQKMNLKEKSYKATIEGSSGSTSDSASDTSAHV